MPRAVPQATPLSVVVPERRDWRTPTLAELPKLTALTLASAIGGGGGTGGGGSTVFGLVLAFGLAAGLSACSSDRLSEPSIGQIPAGATAIRCEGDVVSRSVRCGDEGPSAVPTYEILGGRGKFVALRSGNVHYDGGTEEFTFDVSVQNLTSQVIGTTDGVSPTAINVFFDSDPVAVTGTGSITIINGMTGGTFTGSGQNYFEYPQLLAPGDTTPTQSWEFSMPPAVLTFSFTVYVAAEVPDNGGVLRWELVRPSPDQLDSLIDIAANGPDDAMAVGIHGLVLRKSTDGWEVVSQQSAFDWTGVEGIGNGKFIGATSDGTVWLYQGQVWRPIHHTGWPITVLTAYSLANIAVAGNDHAAWWGSGGDSATSGAPSGGGPWTTAVTYASGNQFLLGSGSGALLQGNFNSPSIALTDAADITAMAATTSSNPLIARFGASGQLEDYLTNIPFVGTAIDSTIDAVTYGAGGVGAIFWRGTRSLTSGDTKLHSWNGSWTSRATVTGTVRAMIDDRNGGLYLLTSRGILRWDGSAIVDEFAEVGAGYTAISGDDNSAIVSLGGSDVMQYENGAWTTRSTGMSGGVGDLLGFGPDDQYAASNAGEVSHWDGSSWSVELGIQPGMAGFADLSGVPGFILAARGKEIWARTGTTWAKMMDGDIPNDSVRSVWVYSPTLAWAVTRLSRTARYDSGDWAEVTHSFQGGHSRITGTGPSDVWVSYADTVNHFNGTIWESASTMTNPYNYAPPGIGSISAIHPFGSGRVYVAGSALFGITTFGAAPSSLSNGLFPQALGGTGTVIWGAAYDGAIWKGTR